jgi:hypothetical protein
VILRKGKNEQKLYNTISWSFYDALYGLLQRAMFSYASYVTARSNLVAKRQEIAS